MSSPYRVTAIIGSTSEKSRTKALVNAIAKSLVEKIDIQFTPIDLQKVGQQFGVATSKEELTPAALQALRDIESSELLIAASPVYKGSYTGLFKHVIDFIGIDALIDRPVILVATGGGDRHALVVEHQLRPLFGFFRAHTLPTAIYASEAELENHQISNPDLQRRVDEATAQAVQLLKTRSSTPA